MKTLDERITKLEKDMRTMRLLLAWANAGVIACVLSVIKYIL